MPDIFSDIILLFIIPLPSYFSDPYHFHLEHQLMNYNYKI